MNRNFRWLIFLVQNDSDEHYRLFPMYKGRDHLVFAPSQWHSDSITHLVDWAHSWNDPCSGENVHMSRNIHLWLDIIPYDVILSCKQWEVLMREGNYSQEISLETSSSTSADFPLRPLKLNFDQALWVGTARIMCRAVASKSWIPRDFNYLNWKEY